MARKITLDELRGEVDKKYGDLEVDDVVLRPALRLPKDKRKKATALLREVQKTVDEAESSDADADGADAAIDRAEDAARKAMEDLVVTVATDAVAARKMVAKLDTAELLTLIEMYVETTQPGEASGSES